MKKVGKINSKVTSKIKSNISHKGLGATVDYLTIGGQRITIGGSKLTF